jgi:hypothetical protein
VTGMAEITPEELIEALEDALNPPPQGGTR